MSCSLEERRERKELKQLKELKECVMHLVVASIKCTTRGIITGTKKMVVLKRLENTKKMKWTMQLIARHDKKWKSAQT